MRVTVEEPNSYARAQGEVYYDATVEVQSPAFANLKSSAAARLKAQVDAKFTDSWVSLQANNATLTISISSDRRYKLDNMLTELESLVNAELPGVKRVNSLNNSIGGVRMALDTFSSERLNSKLVLTDDTALELYNKYAQRIIDTVEDAMSEGSQVLDKDAYRSYKDKFTELLEDAISLIFYR